MRQQLEPGTRSPCVWTQSPFFPSTAYGPTQAALVSMGESGAVLMTWQPPRLRPPPTDDHTMAALPLPAMADHGHPGHVAIS